MTTHTLHYGTTTIQYELTYAQRKTLGITVHPDRSVTVAAPIGSALPQIETLLQRRAGWIAEQLAQLETAPLPPPPRQYISGESYWYLGQTYRLKIEEHHQETVRLTRGYLYVHRLDPQNRAGVKAQLDRWYDQQAERIFHLRLKACCPRVEHLGIACPTHLTLRTMKTRWGSCTPPDKITLNLRLIQAPLDAIDYVILHELCHLKEPSHSPRFYALLDRVLPDWKARKQALNALEIG